MSANPTPAPPPGAAPNDPEAPLHALAAKYPAPDWREYAKDRFWLADQQLSGAPDAYRGKAVAACKQEGVGVGDDYIPMVIELSRKYDVHPGRIVVIGLDE
jgi:hypothetical protein